MNAPPHDRELEEFFESYKLIKFRKGEILFRAEDTPPGVYFLQKGFVRQFVLTNEGTELTLHLYSENSFFPLMWAIGEIPNRFTFDALTPVFAWRAPRDAVIEFLQKNPESMLRLVKRLYQGFDGLLKRIEYLSLGSAQSRVIGILLYLARHFGESHSKEIVIPHRFTHQEISSLAGIVRETTSREIKRLSKEKLIILEDHSIIIPDIDRLRVRLYKRLGITHDA